MITSTIDHQSMLNANSNAVRVAEYVIDGMLDNEEKTNESDVDNRMHAAVHMLGDNPGAALETALHVFYEDDANVPAPLDDDGHAVMRFLVLSAIESAW
jgi:hypothetical protein